MINTSLIKRLSQEDVTAVTLWFAKTRHKNAPEHVRFLASALIRGIIERPSFWIFSVVIPFISALAIGTLRQHCNGTPNHIGAKKKSDFALFVYSVIKSWRCPSPIDLIKHLKLNKGLIMSYLRLDIMVWSYPRTGSRIDDAPFRNE